MGRPKTPMAVLELKGAYRKNPKRGTERAMEPVATGELAPPEQFLRTDLSECPRLLAIWRETIAICWWLTPAEAAPLESYCRLKDKERRGTAKSPDLTNLFKLYPILGMTQDGRGKFRELGVGRTAGSGASKATEWEELREESQRLRVG